ncbi:MAG: hypothetical protein NTZ95_05760 [Candidatus Omnitrophica bacterium]|nr:hypothetical protein [Candidatus Omnitrophota bacterium]
MSFKDIKGEACAIDFLKNAASSDRVASAYIFLGPSGCGKKLTAVNFAKLLNCSGPIEGEPCEKCGSCNKINSSAHPDVLVLEKEEKKAEFGIDIVLEAIRSVSLKPYEARKKVYILDDADLMSEEAQNAVLKTLEEPPQDSLLILMVEDIQAIPATIKSSEKILRDDHLVDVKDARVLARLSLGSIGKALENAKDGFLDKRARTIDALKTTKIFDSDFEKMKRGDFIGCLDIMLSWYRDILVTKAFAGKDASILNIDKIDEIKAEAKRLSFEYLDSAVNAIADAKDHLDRNANPKLTMSVLGIKLEERG